MDARGLMKIPREASIRKEEGMVLLLKQKGAAVILPRAGVKEKEVRANLEGKRVLQEVAHHRQAVKIEVKVVPSLQLRGSPNHRDKNLNHPDGRRLQKEAKVGVRAESRIVPRQTRRKDRHVV